MNRTVLLFTVLLLGGSVFSQKQLQITYENHTYGFRNIRSSKVKVVSTNEACLSIWEDKWHEMECVGRGSNIRPELSHDYKLIKKYHYKDYQSNMIYYSDAKLFECFICEEQKQFKWEIHKEEKEILGYICTKAITHYRGRDYVAWFTTQLPFKAAPWKYHGLPGVMLEVKSLDDFTSMRAISIKITDDEKPENPFKKKRLISWEEFTELYKEKLLRGYKRLQASNARHGISYAGPNRPRIEIICSFNKLPEGKKERWGKRLKEDKNPKEKSDK